MAITTLISWYDEQPKWLAESVLSVASFSSQVIALDGAYALFPNAQRRSAFGQAEAIRETAISARMGCTVIEPTQPWQGNEIEKRSTLFAIAECLTTEDDWYFVLDSDERVISCPYPHLLAETLTETDELVGSVMVKEKEGFFRPYPKLFRALRGIRVVGNHWTYELPDGRRLWGHGHRGKVLEEAADFTGIQVEHRNRSGRREQEAQEYYKKRERANVERDP